MLNWRTLLGLGAVDAALFFVSGWTAHSHEHSGTVSNIVWMDFLLGIVALVALAAAVAIRGVFSLRR